MKKLFKSIALLLVVVTLCLSLASCGKKLSGSYEAEIDGILSKYTATYTFSGKKVSVERKTTGAITGKVESTVIEGTYEIEENKDGTMEITFTFNSEDDEIKSDTYTFEEGEENGVKYIKIGPAKYTKKN